MLGYRSLFTVDSDDDIVGLTREQLYSWLRGKKYDADRLEPGAIVSLADGVECTYLDTTARDGSRSVRARLTEDRENDGRWTSQLTVHIPGRSENPPWIWVDIDAPGEDDTTSGGYTRRWTGTPRLVRNLLEVFRASDGNAVLGPRPQRMSEADAETLLDIVCDPDRRGPVFLAGSDADIPVAKWTDEVDRMLADTVGLAGTYVLDGEATAAFNEMIGETHAVAPGTVRTYLPAADPADPVDALKHRVLSTGRILRDDGKSIRRILGSKARDLTIEVSLPKSAARIDSQFERQIDTLLMEALVPSRTDTSLEANETPKLTEPHTEAETSDESPSSLGAPEETPAVTTEAEGYLVLRQLLAEVTGFEHVDPMTVAELGRFARVGRNAEANTKALQQRLDELQTKNTRSREERDLLTKRLEDEQLDHYQTELERSNLEEQLRSLRGRLARSGHAEYAWDDESVSAQSTPPRSFDDLIAELRTNLPWIVFTGDAQQALKLDEYEQLGNWASKTWRALQALSDYASATNDGRCTTGVTEYLTNPPDDCRTFSANRHARKESESVTNTDRYAKQRTLPVPSEISETGTVFMGAHFKIAQAGQISPRLHYYDGTAVSGYVYVGYIGPHLPTPRTN